ncbi:MAG: hypothetical protein GY915_03280 [bacterium]|nr:hypothetical protein [bacterium]
MKNLLRVFAVGFLCAGAGTCSAEEVDLTAAKKALERACAELGLHHVAQDDVTYVPETGEDSVDINLSPIQPPEEIRIPIRLKLDAFLPDVNLNIAESPQTGELGTLTITRDGKEAKYNGVPLNVLPSKKLKALCGKMENSWLKK